MKKIKYLAFVLLFPAFLSAAPFDSATEATLLKLPQKTLVGVISCILNGNTLATCLTQINPIVLTNNSQIAVDINGNIDLTGTGFAAKGNIVTLYNSHEGENTVIRTINVDANAAKTLVSIPVSGTKGLNLTSQDIATYFSGSRYQRLNIKRPNENISADVYVSVSEDLVADKITILAAPDLRRTYNPTTKAESLIATFRVSLRSERKSAVTIPKTGAFFFQSINGTQGSLNSSVGVTYEKPTGAGVVDYGSYYIIKENSAASFIVKATFNPRVMFAGSYRVQLAGVNFGDTNGSNYAFQQVSSTAKFNKTDAVTIIGELSPYVSSAQFTRPNNKEVLSIGGVRFTSSDAVYIGSLRIGTTTATTPTSITIPLTQAQIAQQLSAAGVQPYATDGTYQSYSLTVRNSNLGVSNNFNLTISNPLVTGDETTNAQTCPVSVSLLSTSTTLTVGSQGNDVRNLKCFLNNRGFLLGNYMNDYFGVQTRTALSTYQAFKGISPQTGVLGPLTIGIINTDIINGTGSSATTPAVTIPTAKG